MSKCRELGSRQSRRTAVLLATTVALVGAQTGAALACAVCYGESDSPLAAGMNLGIFSLLGCILAVLGGVAGFFVFLARRAGRLARTGEQQGRI